MIDPNKYAQQKALHEKCLAILNGIEEFSTRLNSAEDHLNRFDSATPYAPIRLMNYRWQLEHRIDILQRCVSRMERYYIGKAGALCSILPKQPIHILTLPEVSKEEREKFLRMWMGSANEIYTLPESHYSALAGTFNREEAWKEGIYGKGYRHIVEPLNYGYEELNSHKPNDCFHGTPDGTGPNSNVPGYC